jgi:hypothetical protein
MKCKNDSTRSYKGTEPSPKGLGYCAHVEKVGITKKGKDKNQWLIKKVGKSQRWIKLISKPKGKKYYIHDNGGRPFEVIIGQNLVSIYKWTDLDDKEDKVYNKLVKTYKSFEKVFIGKSNVKYAKGKFFDGNSILLKLSKHKYVFIGQKIYSFTTRDEIKKYISTVGNSDVPYPYAIGTKNVYLMISDVYVPLAILPKKYLEVKKEDDHAGPYGYYYLEKKIFNKKHKLKYRVIHKRLW